MRATRKRTTVSIPKVPCYWAVYGCKEEVLVTDLRNHIAVCGFHPSRVCPRLHTTPEGQLLRKAYIMPALQERQPQEGEIEAKEAWDRFNDGLLPEGELCSMYWWLAYSLPLASAEAILPGFQRILGEGYAYDAENDYEDKCADAWPLFQDALQLAQIRYHRDLDAAQLNEDEQEAARLLKKLGIDEVQAKRTRASTHMSIHESIIFLDLSRAQCIAVELLGATLNDRAALQESLRKWEGDFGPKAIDELVNVVEHCDVPRESRLRALRHRPFPRPVLEDCQAYFAKLKKEKTLGRKQAIRLLRKGFQKCPWVSRTQVNELIASLEHREFILPEQPTPIYWTKHSSLPGYSFAIVALPQEEHGPFQSILDSTWRSKTTQDRQAKLADRFVVTNVQRVENERAWSEYAVRRDQICRERWATGTCSEIPDIKLDRSLLPHQEPSASQSPHEDQRFECFADAWAGPQELILFHGTKRDAALHIALENFSTEFSAESGLFGAGLYFAESISKSDEYCCEEGPDSECTILLCRVCMGRHRVLDTDNFNIKEVIREMEELGEHSVLGDREAFRGTYREFICYDGAAAYVEYIISYKRLFGSDATQCRESAMEQLHVDAEERSARLAASLEAARAKLSGNRPRQTVWDSDIALNMTKETTDKHSKPTWGYVGGRREAGVRVDFVEDPGAAWQYLDIGLVTCLACGQTFTNSDQLRCHLEEYADSDGTGAHKGALKAYQDEETATAKSACSRCRSIVTGFLAHWTRQPSHRQPLKFFGGDTSGTMNTE